MRLLVGGRAARNWFADYPYAKNPKSDFDFITDEPKRSKDAYLKSKDKKDNFDFKYVQDNPALLYILKQHEGRSSHVCNFVHLYTLYLSRAFFDINWKTTMQNILFFQQKNVREDQTLLKALYDGWCKRYGHTKMFSKAFFAGLPDKSYKVFTKYRHSDIHKIVKHFDKPIINSVSEDHSHRLNYRAFSLLPYEFKIKLCREEIYTTAAQYFLIPSNFKMSPEEAYEAACRALITSKRGFWPMFMVLNWIELHDMGGDEWHKKLKSAIKSKKLKPAKSGKATIQKNTVVVGCRDGKIICSSAKHSAMEQITYRILKGAPMLKGPGRIKNEI